MKNLPLVLCSVLVSLWVSHTAVGAEDSLAPELWIEDLDYLVEQIYEIHIAPFHTVSENAFEKHIADLRARIPELPGGEIALEFSRLVATIGDGHTWISPYLDATLRLPIAVRPYSDGVYVTHAMPPYGHLERARITRIGSADPADVLRAAEPYVSRDNEWTVRARTPILLSVPEFLKLAGVIDEVGAVRIELETLAGEPIAETLETVSFEAFGEWLDAAPDPQSPPLYRQRPDEAYWFEPLPEHDTVFVKFNKVRNHENGPHLARFSREMLEAVDATGAAFLIVDVRHNGGGNGDLLRPLIRRISEHKRINRRRHLYVITSRYTFSAALMFVARMELATKVTFAGEPSGGKPNSYGEFNGFTLPNSKLSGSISSRYHAEGLPNDEREFIPVRIEVPLTGTDYFAGTDPVLDAVLERIDSRR